MEEKNGAYGQVSLHTPGNPAYGSFNIKLTSAMSQLLSWDIPKSRNIATKGSEVKQLVALKGHQTEVTHI